MAVLPIRIFPDPLLKTPALPVARITQTVHRLIDDLIGTMRSHPRCVGLAAPQVGVSLRVAVVDVTGHPKAPRASGLMVLVNPQLVGQASELIQREGCLSIPDFTANVRRAFRVQVTALDRVGKPWSRWLEEFEAIAVQHELDHLDGTLFLDRVANVRTDVFRRKRYWFPETR
jgi:peptide deformylase